MQRIMENQVVDRDGQTHQVIGAAFEVHRVLGCGFLEQVYQDALAVEFAERDITYEREVLLRVLFKGKTLAAFYRPDFICFGQVMVEIKASVHITPVDMAQMINYLRASGIDRGLIINFGGKCLELRRVIFSHAINEARVDDEAVAP